MDDFPAKLGQWFDAYSNHLLLYARSRGEGAEDVVQDAFVRLAGECAAGRSPGNIRAWLFACVRNGTTSAHRAAARRREREGWLASNSKPWFDAKFEDKLDAADAQAALATLPDAQREIVVLRLWSGLTLAEIASVVKTPLSTVHDHYRAALVAVRKAMRAREASCRKMP